MFFYLPNICLQDNRLTLYGEITNWSLLGESVKCGLLLSEWYGTSTAISVLSV